MQQRIYQTYKPRILEALLIGLLIVLPAHLFHGQTKVDETLVLELGKPVEREFSTESANHRYRIGLAMGQYASIIVNQRGIDVSVHLLLDDKAVTRFDGEARLQEEERVEFVAEQAGDYYLDLRKKSTASSGAYEIRMTDERAATEQDRLRFESHTLIVKAVDLDSAGKYADAAQLVTRALEIRERQYGTEDVRLGAILSNLGYLQRQQGLYPAAEASLLRALSINEKGLGPEHPTTIRAVTNLGMVYRSTNEFAKADKVYRRALAAGERVFGKDHPQLVDTLISFSALLGDLKNLEQEEQILQRALAIVEKNSEANTLQAASIVNNLGVNFQYRGDNERAERYFRRVLAIYERTIGTENDRYSNTLQNIGIVLRARKDYAGALEIYERALKIRENTLGREHLNLAPLLQNISNAHQSLGDFAMAITVQQRGLDIAEKVGGLHHSHTINALRNLARFFSARGDVASAVRFQIMAEERTEKALSLNLAIGSERQKLILLGDLAEKTSRTISLHVSLTPDDPEVAALAALVLLQRKGRVLDAMSDNLSTLRSRFGAEDQKLLDALQAVTAQLAKLTLSKPVQMTLDEHRKQVADLEEKKEVLEAGISNHSQQFRARSQTVTLAAVQAEIPTDAALVEFAIYEPYNPKAQSNREAYGNPRYIAYLLRRTGDVEWKDLGEAKAIEALITEWRKALRDSKRKDVEIVGRQLEEKVMGPVRQMAGDATHFLISPDGALNLIPFEALVDERDRFLIEHYSFTYLTSGRDLLRMRGSRASDGKSLILASPSFGDPVEHETAETKDRLKSTAAVKNRRRSLTSVRNLSETYFAPISGTLNEARSIHKYFPEMIFASGTQATESLLRETAAPELLHIATHGFFLEDIDDDAQPIRASGPPAASKNDNPLLRSGLALANANVRKAGAGDDGILTALEASNLNLWGTKLVVLSACDTGLGEVKNGEGVYGLRRAFVLAGAQSLVMSLWSVSDAITRDLMIGYYRNLRQEKGRGASLREVQLTMLKRKGREHPFYWAGFIQSGEWGSLNSKR